MSRKSAALAVSEGQSTRRQFLRTSAAVTGSAIAAPTIIPSSALGLDGAVAPSERIVVGGIGIGRRGGYDLGCFLQQKDVQFVAVCDIKEKRRAAVKKQVDAHHSNDQCATYRDFRELLDRSDIDAVLIATPTMNHIECALAAIQRGIHVLMEKTIAMSVA